VSETERWGAAHRIAQHLTAAGFKATQGTGQNRHMVRVSYIKSKDRGRMLGVAQRQTGYPVGVSRAGTYYILRVEEAHDGHIVTQPFPDCTYTADYLRDCEGGSDDDSK